MSSETNGTAQKVDAMSTPASKTMKAVVWEGHVGHMSVKEVPRPMIKYPTDVIVKLTTAAICGTDLHVLDGIIGATDPHWNMGHEGVGVIVEVGSDIRQLKVGQRVLIPDATPFDTAAPNDGFAIYGIGNILNAEDLGGLQAEYARIPLADQFAVPLPADAKDEDYVLLSDIWPTAWGAVDRSGFMPGDTVAVFGCGPVGLLGQYSCLLRGASKVYAIDHVASRLAKAKSLGAIPIDLRNGDPATQILKLEPNGVNRTLDLVGYECVNAKLEPDEGYILNQAVQLTTTGGGIGIIGVYYGTHPSAGSPRQSEKLRFINFDISTFWIKSLSMSGGIVFPQQIVPRLMALIESGKAKPSIIIDRVININEAEQAYIDFRDHKYGKTLIRFPH